jgi:ribonuclease HI
MAMRSRRITCKAHSWVYESKQIYWDLQQLNYDVKLMWIPSYVGISGNEVADELARHAAERESSTDNRRWPITTGYWLDKQWKYSWWTEDTGRFDG